MDIPRGMTGGPTPAHDPLVVALDGVGAAVQKLVGESREERRAQARRDRRNTWLLAVIALLLVVIGALAVQNRAINDSNREILQTVRECTAEEAPGDCYERGQARTGAAVAELLTGQFDIAWCVKISETRAAAQACVTAARRKSGN